MDFKDVIPAIPPTMLGALAAIFFDRETTFWGFVGRFFISAFVGWLTFWFLKDYKFSYGIQGLIIGSASFCSDNVLRGVRKLSLGFAVNPMGVINSLTNKGKN